MSTLKAAEKLNENAHRANSLIGQVNIVNAEPRNDATYSQNSILSGVINFYSVYFRNGLEQELFNAEFSSKLGHYSKTVLCLFGKYDFVVPPALADYIIASVGSTFKKKVILEKSAHDPYLTETERVNSEIFEFVEQFK